MRKAASKKKLTINRVARKGKSSKKRLPSAKRKKSTDIVDTSGLPKRRRG